MLHNEVVVLHGRTLALRFTSNALLWFAADGRLSDFIPTEFSMTQSRHESRFKFFRGLGLQVDVLGALIIRELYLRFGRDNIGYLWLIGEPMMFATAISVLHTVYNSGHHTGDMGPFPFTLIGYTLFIILRGVVNRAESALDSSISLLYHRMVTIFDVLLTRAIVEVIGCFCAFIVLCTLAVMAGYAYAPVRPLYVLMAFGWMLWISFALSLIVAGSTFDKPLLARLVHPMTYFMIPLSGAFWTMAWLPRSFQDIMVWNPLVTIFEHARYGMFRSASDKFLFPGYITAICCFLTYCGMISVLNVRKKVHLS